MSAVLCLTLFMMLLDGSKLYSEATHGHDHGHDHGHGHGHGHGHEHGPGCRRDHVQGVQERKVNVDGVDINYVRTGNGEHPILLLPGGMGWSWYNFRPQIEGLDGEKFTIIAWDPPGYGKSRPPNRTFPLDFYSRDATWARNLMRTLGFEKFSPVGWSDGGISAMILTANYPQNVRKLISVSANSYLSPEEIVEYRKIRNIDVLPDLLRTQLTDYYGEPYFRSMWADWIDFFDNIYRNKNGDLCLEALPKIKAPTLIIQGQNDTGVPAFHPVYLRDHIQGAKMKIIPNATHPVQLEYPQEFNSVVTKFLTEGIVT
ncbi:valacyclovir hydrolase-like isoform X2 [Hylaeus anthracinus]|uniref:valacyclovir hydrolase-like isoform X2 n=1 Tax=Hylaeus anthracinus TaxID=313031 RepID=UPI0023B9F982|nr:valacyclovir hydrolase-like isoform X2 [Hylaeus anthracinus]